MTAASAARASQFTDLSRRQALALVVVLLLATAFIRFSGVSHTPPGAAADSTTNLADGLRISRGLPFAAYFTDRPELIERWLVGGWFALTGASIYSTQTLQLFFGLVALALTYRAGLLLLVGRSWRRVGALVAVATLAQVTFLIFLTRASYRAIMLPPMVLGIFIALVVAYRTRRWQWNSAAGLLAGTSIHLYTAGLMAPLWALGLILHQLVFPDRVRRSLHPLLYLLLGLLVPVALWLGLITAVPDLYRHAGSITNPSTLPFPLSILAGLWGSVRAYWLEGHFMVSFNTPDTPILNPVVGLLAIVGIIAAAWRWRTVPGALLLGGIVAFSVPGALSYDNTYPVRLVGAMPLLALLAGWGAVRLIDLSARFAMRLSRQRWTPFAHKWGVVIAVVLVASVSLQNSYAAYYRLFVDARHYQNNEGPFDWRNIPQVYTIAFADAMSWLAKVDRPTYVPLWVLDNPLAAFMLQKQAFPNVTTWARYGLKELPEGQFFFPSHWYYHFPLKDETAPFPDVVSTRLRVLLLPAEKTIVILPASGLPDSVIGPLPFTNDIQNAQGWIVGRTRSIARSPLATTLPAADQQLPVVGDGLKLITPALPDVKPGQPAEVLLQWVVTSPQPADLFSVVQMLRQDLNAVAGGSNHYIMQYFYPSARWQPGDVIPDPHRIDVPADLPEGNFRLGAGVYVPPSKTRLAVSPPDAQDYGPQLRDLWLWGGLRHPLPQLINAPLPATTQPLEAQFGDQIALTGYTVERTQTTLNINLYWRALKPVTGDYTIFVHAQQGEKMAAQQDQKPLDGKLPTWVWQAGELITTTHSLTLPPDSAESADSLYIGLYSYPSLTRLTVVQSGQRREDRRVLIPLKASP